MDLSIIKEIRKEKNLSQQELGNKLGVSGAYIQQIETNKKNPSMKTLNRIAEALEVPKSILLEFNPFNKSEKFNIQTLEQEFDDINISKEKKESVINVFKGSMQLKLTKIIFENLGYKIDLSCSPIIFIKELETGRDVSELTFEDLEKIIFTINLTNESIINKLVSDYKIKEGEDNGK